MGWMPGWFKSILNMVTYRAIQGGEIPVLYKYRKPDAKDLYRVQGYVDTLLEKQVRKWLEGRRKKCYEKNLIIMKKIISF